MLLFYNSYSFCTIAMSKRGGYFPHAERWGRKSAWQNLPTTLIRVPEVLVEQILEYAHKLDNEQVNKVDSQKMDQATMLKMMDEFVESLQGQSGGNQYKSKGEVKTSGTRWYFYRQFREWVKNNKLLQ